MSAQGWTAVPHSVARSTSLSVNAKAVYLAIASRADVSGKAWPSRDLIAQDAGLSVASVRRALPELRDAGLVDWEQKTSGNGTPYAANRYRILSGGGSQGPTPVGHTGLPPGSQGPTPGSERPTGVGHTDPQRTTSRRTPKKNTAAHAHGEQFELFWLAYPRKIGKGRARPAWMKAITTTDPAVILAAAERFAVEQAATEPKFIPHPTTWINAERWTDEPAPRAPRPVGSAIWDKPARPYEEDIA